MTVTKPDDWFATEAAEPPAERHPVSGAKEFVRILFARKWLIVLIVLMVEGGIGLGVYWWLLPSYETKARVHIDLQSGAVPMIRSSQSFVSDLERIGFFETVQQEMKTRSIFINVATRLDLGNRRALGRLEIIRNWYLDVRYDIGMRWNITSWQRRRDPFAAAVAAIDDNLTISRLENSTILELVYQAHDAEECQQTLAAVIEEYIAFRNGFIRQKALGSSDFLRQQVERIEADLRAGEGRWLEIVRRDPFHLLPDMSATSAAAPPVPPGDPPAATLASAGGDDLPLEPLDPPARSRAQPPLPLAERDPIDLDEAVAAAPAAPQPAAAAAAVDPRVYGLVTNQRTVDEMSIKLIALQEELERILALNNENHPVVPKLRELIAAYKRTINDSPALQVELRGLQRGLETKEKLYTELQAAYQNALTLESQELKRLDIVKVIQEPDLPGAHKSPKRMLALSAGLPVGLLLGLVLAVIVEFLNNTVKGPEDVQRLGLEYTASLKRA